MCDTASENAAMTTVPITLIWRSDSFAERSLLESLRKALWKNARRGLRLVGLPVKHSQLSIRFVFREHGSILTNAFSFFLDRHQYRGFSGLSFVFSKTANSR